MQKKLLVVAHTPSKNTRNMLNHLMLGAEQADTDNLIVKWIEPLKASAKDVLECDAIILGTPENLGYMSGALKDFFDRIYYPCLESKQGLPFVFFIRAGHDGTGTKNAILSICNGMKWKQIQPELICHGPWDNIFLSQCKKLGENVACGLDFGIY